MTYLKELGEIKLEFRCRMPKLLFLLIISIILANYDN